MSYHILGKEFLNAIKLAYSLFVNNPNFPDIYSVGGNIDGVIILYAHTNTRLTDRDILLIESIKIGDTLIKVIRLSTLKIETF